MDFNVCIKDLSRNERRSSNGVDAKSVINASSELDCGGGERGDGGRLVDVIGFKCGMTTTHYLHHRFA